MGISGNGAHTTISGNAVYTDTTGATSSRAIDSNGDFSLIASNVVSTDFYGLRIAGYESSITGNNVYMTGAVANAIAIYIYTRSSSVTGNVIDGTQITSATAKGINVFANAAASRNIISSNNIYNSQAQGFLYSIYAPTATDNVIANNNIAVVPDIAAAMGIYVLTGARNKITGNSISSVYSIGIRANNALEANISGNTIQMNGARANMMGISLVGTSVNSNIMNNIIDGMLILTNTSNAIDIAGASTGALLLGNKITGDATHGFARGVYSAANNTVIKDNVMDYCSHLVAGQVQIQCDGDDCTISGNDLTGHTNGVAIVASTSQRTKIENNKMVTAQAGIQVSGADISILGNTIIATDSLGNSIYANNALRCKINDNTVIDAGLSDKAYIDVTGASDYSCIQDNTIDLIGFNTNNNTNALIECVNVTYMTVTGNKLIGSATVTTRYGIRVGTDSIVSNNHLYRIGSSGYGCIVLQARCNCSGNSLLETLSSYGIALVAGDCIITSNRIRNAAAENVLGIYSNSFDNLIITSNYIDLSQGAPATGRAFELINVIDYTLVKNNLWKDGGGASTFPVGVGNIIVDNINLP